VSENVGSGKFWRQQISQSQARHAEGLSENVGSGKVWRQADKLHRCCPANRHRPDRVYIKFFNFRRSSS